MEELRIGIVGCGGIANGKHMPALSKRWATCAPWPPSATSSRSAPYKARAKNTARPTPSRLHRLQTAAGRRQHRRGARAAPPMRCHCPITVDGPGGRQARHVRKAHGQHQPPTPAKCWTPAKKSGKKLTIGYQNRFRPGGRRSCKKAVRPAVSWAKSTLPRHMPCAAAPSPPGAFSSTSMQQGGGPLIDIGTHALDLTLWMMNNYEPASRCWDTVFKKLGHPEPSHRGQRLRATGIPRSYDGGGFRLRHDPDEGRLPPSSLESSWALNIRWTPVKPTTTLCGTLAGADMRDGVRFNMVDLGCQTVKKPDLSAGGVAFFEGSAGMTPAQMEAHYWINAILNDTDPMVLPEQALTVTEILEAIYTSAKTGKACVFRLNDKVS